MRKFLWLLIALLCLGIILDSAHAQIAVEQAMGASTPLNQNLLVRDREVSAANTALTQTYDLGNTAQVLAIQMVCSAGTATLTIAASSDNSNFITIDVWPTATPIVKNYNNSTVGTTGAGFTAVSPLAFRWVRITAGTCGASNTSTLTVAAK